MPPGPTPPPAAGGSLLPPCPRRALPAAAMPGGGTEPPTRSEPEGVGGRLGTRDAECDAGAPLRSPTRPPRVCWENLLKRLRPFPAGQRTAMPAGFLHGALINAGLRPAGELAYSGKRCQA